MSLIKRKNKTKHKIPTKAMNKGIAKIKKMVARTGGNNKLKLPK